MEWAGVPERIQIVETVRQILIHLDRLDDLGLTARIRRETIFYLYEGGEARKWHFDRPHSAAARVLRREALQVGAPFSSKYQPVTYDHAVPLATLRAGLRRATASLAEMDQFLWRHIHGVVILKEENARLLRAGLASSMPPGAATDDALARYRQVRIEFEPEDAQKLTHPGLV